MPLCPRNQELAEALLNALSHIVQLTNRQMEAIRKGDHPLIADQDSQLEQAVGEKERALGAWREHAEEHGCCSDHPIRGPPPLQRAQGTLFYAALRRFAGEATLSPTQPGLFLGTLHDAGPKSSIRDIAAPSR